jgi:hypothetical protein
MQVYRALAQSRDGLEGTQRLLSHPNLSCLSRQQKCANALHRPSLSQADLVTPEASISRAHATNRKKQSSSDQVKNCRSVARRAPCPTTNFACTSAVARGGGAAGKCGRSKRSTSTALRAGTGIKNHADVPRQADALRHEDVGLL